MLFATSTYTTIVRPLQILVLVAAGLFFLRILRVASIQMSPEGEERGKGRHRALALVYLEPDELAGQRIDIVDGLTLGRSGASDVVLNDSFLSSRHARLSEDDGDFFIEDLGSTNGTYVNAEAVVHRTQIIKGDVIQLGNLIFEVAR